MNLRVILTKEDIELLEYFINKIPANGRGQKLKIDVLIEKYEALLMLVRYSLRDYEKLYYHKELGMSPAYKDYLKNNFTLVNKRNLVRIIESITLNSRKP